MSLTSVVKETAYSTPKKYHLSNFLKNQRNSWQWFLKKGLRHEFDVYKNVPIQLRKNLVVNVTFNASQFKFVRPSRSIKSCILERRNYSSPLYMPVVVKTNVSKNDYRFWVCISHLPLMTNNGHFIINGSPRVVLNQLVRSPGVYFRSSKKKRLVADFIPLRGAWLRLEMSPCGQTNVLMKNVLKTPIDQFLVTSGLNLKLISPYINLFLNKSTTLLGPALGDLPVNLNTRTTPHQKKDMLVDLALKLYGVDPEEESFYVEKPDIISLFCCKQEHMFLFEFANGKKPPSSGVLSNDDLRWQMIDYESSDDSLSESPLTSTSLTLKEFFKHRKQNRPLTKINHPERIINWLNYSHQRTVFYDGSLYKTFWQPDSKNSLKTYPNKSHIYHSEIYDQENYDSKWQAFMTRKDKTRRADLLQSYFATDTFRRRLYQPFFKYANYNLSFAGRAKLNKTLGISLPLNLTTLTALDVLFGYFYLLECAYNNKVLSDIDHLKNRCVRSMGELIQNQIAIGLQHLVQQMKAKPPSTRFFYQLVGHNPDPYKNWKTLSINQMPRKRRGKYSNYLSGKKMRKRLLTWIDPKPIDTVLKGFFGTNPLSQFLDMTNSLAELTHKRRLSALGIGGIDRTTATMDIRGIHSSHYGRICPIETPEGKNAGLVNSFTSHALLNITGEIKTPYYRCHQGIIFDEATPVLFGPQDENNWALCAGDVERGPLGLLLGTHGSDILPVPSRQQNEYYRNLRHEVDYIALSPIQMISVATSHIPFLEHNDGNRALMGSNMQRQAVPTIQSQRPIVGTGFESQSVANIGLGCHTKEAGFVAYVDGQRIILYTKLQTKVQPQLLPTSNLSVTNIRDQKSTLKGPVRVSEVIQLYIFMLLNQFMALKFTLQSPNKLYQSMTQISALDLDNFSRLEVTEVSPKPQDLGLLGRAFGGFWHYDQSVFCGKQKTFSQPYTKSATVKKPPSLVHPKGSFLYKPLGSQQNAVSLRPDVRHAGKFSVYKLDNFFRSNQNTYRVHRPNVGYGDWVRPGDLLADNTCSCKGELAVGQNILVGYTPWQGYNFEDAVLLNQRMIYDDVFTSLHVERYTVDIRDTQFGAERLRPSVSGRLKKDGVIPVGSWVQPGDPLVSKYAPSNDYARSPFEVLLFDVLRLPVTSELLRNTSVLTPHDVYGRVIHVEYMQSQTKSKLARRRSLALRRLGYTIPVYDTTHDFYYGSISKPRSSKSKKVSKACTPRGRYHAQKRRVRGPVRGRRPNNSFNIKTLTGFANNNSTVRNQNQCRFKTTLTPMPCPIISQVNSSKRKSTKKKKYIGKIAIYIAIKRRIQVGDKLSGRHGNKGIVSRLLPREDMPYLQDGTPLDIVLNPLGVPSRMNVGQIFETLLGFAGSFLHQNYKVRPFDEIHGCEASRSLVYSKLYEARQATNQSWLFNANFPGKVRLFDGVTGQCFNQPVTVGKSYILKLIHMVDEKIHARNTGPYSLITQQPVRGRSKQGGQRFGEMEGWAIEGYAAPYVLHELFNIKSDDLIGRKKLPNDIIYQKRFTYSIPEAFRVLMLELRGLCTNFQMFESYDLNDVVQVFGKSPNRNQTSGQRKKKGRWRQRT